MLGVLLLNVVGIGAAVYFLNILIVGQQSHLKSLLEVQDKQQTEIILMHKGEFEALLTMNKTLQDKITQPPPPPPPAPDFPFRPEAPGGP